MAGRKRKFPSNYTVPEDDVFVDCSESRDRRVGQRLDAAPRGTPEPQDPSVPPVQQEVHEEHGANTHEDDGFLLDERDINIEDHTTGVADAQALEALGQANTFLGDQSPDHRRDHHNLEVNLATNPETNLEPQQSDPHQFQPHQPHRPVQDPIHGDEDQGGGGRGLPADGEFHYENDILMEHGPEARQEVGDQDQVPGGREIQLEDDNYDPDDLRNFLLHFRNGKK